jgi:hypothetical protein
MTKQDFKNLLLNAQLPTWENLFFEKLEKISQVKLKLKAS